VNFLLLGSRIQVMTADPALVPSPDPDIYVLVISHAHGQDVTVHARHEDAESAAAGYARDRWEEIAWQAGIPDSPDSLEDRMAIRLYFDAFVSENHSIIPLQLPKPEVEPGLGREQIANRTARFLPARDEDEEPAIDLAGALVIAWIRDGELNVNIGLESADLGIYRAVGEEKLIAVRVTVMGDTVAELGTSPQGTAAPAPRAGSAKGRGGHGRGSRPAARRAPEASRRAGRPRRT
jgi:hypothetical protein